MANGGGPDCVSCANFHSAGTPENPVRLDDPRTKCICRLHRVVLPLSETPQLLLCREWTHHRTGANLGFLARMIYRPGMVYASPNHYTRPVRWRAIAAMQKVANDV
jgi:hypothetical protein